MDSVGRPLLGAGVDSGGIEQTVKRDKRIGVILRHSAHRLNPRIEILAPARTLFGNMEHKGFHDNYFDIRVFASRVLKQRTVDALKLFYVGRLVAVISAPRVVYSDKHGEHIGMEIEAVGLPAVTQVADPVPADAEV